MVTVDAVLRQQKDDLAMYWREVLWRVMAVIKFLIVRCLSFRGDDELLGSSSNAWLLSKPCCCFDALVTGFDFLFFFISF